MSDEKLMPSRSPSQLQEAIDMVVQAFDHPEMISIDHTLEDSEKRTIFEVTVDGEISRYKLVYEAGNKESEPELVRLD